jgi:hypothetical protein
MKLASFVVAVDALLICAGVAAAESGRWCGLSEMRPVQRLIEQG